MDDPISSVRSYYGETGQDSRRCANRHVAAMLVRGDELVGCGTNARKHPSPPETCPRNPGEGYYKCIHDCHQSAHAEIMAMIDAGPELIHGSRGMGLTMYIYGHDRVCETCATLMTAYDIKWVIVSD